MQVIKNQEEVRTEANPEAVCSRTLELQAEAQGTRNWEGLEPREESLTQILPAGRTGRPEAFLQL